jgi:hypothetical protein
LDLGLSRTSSLALSNQRLGQGIRRVDKVIKLEVNKDDVVAIMLLGTDSTSVRIFAINF